ncbi:MAG: hypothetical protein K0R17_1156 [Rariglobus sp.]|jgi:hypothetical protein|nr:hypothetical protein [Rariglobus sp.]
MKSLRLPLALLVAAFAFSNLARAEDPKPALAGEPAACCKKNAEAGKACPHGCCATAAKDDKNCEKCGGKNAPKPDKAT